jgi:hypothetical protein
MTVMTELNALSLTANAKAVVSAKGADINSLLGQAKLATGELQKILKQIQTHHPSGGGDAANLTAIGVVIAELA